MLSLLKISTSSEAIIWPITVTPKPPTITLDGRSITPSLPPTSPTGYQVVVIDPSVDPPTVLSTQYVELSTASQNWMTTAWGDMYSNLQAAIGSASPKHILVVASYGMDINLCPVNPVLTTLENAGAHKLKNEWVDPNNDCGSESGSPNVWIQSPFSYIFIGSLSTTEALEALLKAPGPLELKSFV